MPRIRKTTGFIIIALVAIAVTALYIYSHRTSPSIQKEQITALRSFVDAANKASGIQSGTTFNYVLVGIGNPTNFGILRCQDEIRCSNVVSKQVAKFQQSNESSKGTAEVDTDTNMIVSFHRAVPESVGDEYSSIEIEKIVRDFLKQVYPEFKTIEPTLTFAPGMKGIRLNNGNYFFRWNDEQFKLSEDLSMDAPPFVQVGITSNGFIFGYDNTISFFKTSIR